MLELITLHPWLSFGGLICFSGIIELVPIKINPWSCVARKIGNAMNRDIGEKIEEIEVKLDEHIKADGEENAEAKRTKILRFGNELIRGDSFTREHWRNMLQNIDKYETFCEQNNDFHNNEAVLTIAYIKKQYENALKENNFLE